MSHKELMVRFFESRMAGEEMEKFLQWMLEDVTHVQEFLQERKKYDLELLLNGSLTVPVDVELEYKKIQEFIEKDKRDQARKARLRKRSLWIRYTKPVAACIVVLIGCFFIWKQISLPSGKDITSFYPDSPTRYSAQLAKTTPDGYQVVQVLKGDKKELHLSDGTKVWLNSQSIIKYPEKFDRNTREVWLEGEAYFDVARDVKKLFIVHTHEFDIRVYGTRFNVFAYHQYPEKLYTLVEGSIALKSNTDADSKELQLAPGQQAVYHEEEGRLNIKDIDPVSEVSWKDNNFYFKEKTFQEICRQLEISFDVAIIIKGDGLKNSVYSGDFVRNENLSDILSIMSSDQRMEYKINGDTIIITEKYNHY